MGIESSIIDNVLILKINSELLSETDNNQFDNFLNDNLDKGISKIVIDITGVSYFNSSHIGLIVRLYSTAKNKNATLTIGGSGKRISDLLEGVKLSSIITVFPSVAEAIDSF
ncbi:MAG: STAS domain-containing protein [Melioribacteraceae bacterium]|nr:STAS domain-containing protein [Melioribacteraceae bacterium]